MKHILMRVSCSHEFFMSDLLKSTSNGNILCLAEGARILVPAHGLSETRDKILLAVACLASLLLCITVNRLLLCSGLSDALFPGLPFPEREHLGISSPMEEDLVVPQNPSVASAPRTHLQDL